MLFIKESLLLRDFVAVEDTILGEQAVQRAARARYIVIRFADGRWAVMPPADLERKLDIWNKLQAPLSQVPPNVFAPHLVGILHKESTDPRDQAFVDNLKEKDILILLEGDQVAALVIGETVVRGPWRPVPKTLDGDDQPPPSPAAPQADAKEDTTRYINVDLKDRDGQRYDPKARPLEKEMLYTLGFEVDTKKDPGGLSSAEFVYQFGTSEEMVTITVRLETEDFTLLEEPEKKLFVPRRGKSKNKVTFAIEPKHDGECLINAIFLKEGNFIQVMTLRFYVGALYSSETLGRGVAAAFTARPRDVSLTILNANGEFKLILVSPAAAATATLPIKLPELKDIADEARQKLLDLVNMEEGGVRYYQQMIDIPGDANAAALQYLAKAGARLYQRIFFNPEADQQVVNLGRRLAELARKETLHIQIFSQDFVLPWAMLYVAEPFDPKNIQPEMFLGLKHIIEHIPLQQGMFVTDNRVDSASGFGVSLNVNTDIDRDWKTTLVADQVKYWQDLESGGLKIGLVERTTRDEVTAALSNPATSDKVLYFYCHGVSRDIGEKGGLDQSKLILSGRGELTYEDLNLEAPNSVILPNAPLVFINACESAQLSPLASEGFVRYFMSKGARGVIGTECETPALFAVEFAKRFFDCFLEGETLGQIFLDLRREFFYKHNNFMGLLYSLYVDADTYLEPALRAAGK